MRHSNYDIVIVGGGIMGSALAYYLTHADSRLKVAVVERDPAYEKASTTLSMANARIQFSLEQNVQVSRYTFQVLEHFEEEMAVEDRRPHIAFRREGNLFLVDESGRKAARKALEMQQRLGCEVEWWETGKIRQRYPLYNPQAYGGGTFGPQDGHFDAYAVLMAYRAKARSQGALYVADEVTALLTGHGKARGVQLRSGGLLNAPQLVNCAGAWCAQVARSAGVALPVQPVKRQVFAVEPAQKPDGPLPLTILPSGLYFRTETGGLILVGKSMPEDSVGFDFSWDSKRFTDLLWPELWEFVPAFDRLKLKRGWAGLYAVNTLDGNAIVGQWPEIEGLYLANGFSGHGLQQAPAVARYLAECMLGLPVTLDLSVFDPGRILSGHPVSENGLV